jgi:glucose-6-phosphate-specific signal transduction histidine kinase
MRPAAAPTVREPWFRERPEFTIALSVLLFLSIFVLRVLVGDLSDGYSQLFALPVALLATAFGRRWGFLSAVVAELLVLAWVLIDDVPITVSGWVSRIVPMVLLGLLVGDASDRLRRTEEEKLELAAAARMHREAIEINDSLIQGMAAAKWALESGRTESGLAALDETIVQGHNLVSALIRDAGLGSDSSAAPPN